MPKKTDKDISLSDECLKNLAEWAERIVPSTSGRKLVDLKALQYYNSKLNSRLNERFESIEDRIDRLENALSSNEKRELFMAQLNVANQRCTNYEHELLMAQLNASNQQQMCNMYELLNSDVQTCTIAEKIRQRYT